MVVLHMHYVPQLAAVRPGINLFDKMAHGGVRKHVVRPDYTGKSNGFCALEVDITVTNSLTTGMHGCRVHPC